MMKKSNKSSPRMVLLKCSVGGGESFTIRFTGFDNSNKTHLILVSCLKRCFNDL